MPIANGVEETQSYNKGNSMMSLMYDLKETGSYETLVTT